MTHIKENAMERHQRQRAERKENILRLSERLGLSTVDVEELRTKVEAATAQYSKHKGTSQVLFDLIRDCTGIVVYVTEKGNCQSASIILDGMTGHFRRAVGEMLWENPDYAPIVDIPGYRLLHIIREGFIKVLKQNGIEAASTRWNLAFDMYYELSEDLYVPDVPSGGAISYAETIGELFSKVEK